MKSIYSFTDYRDYLKKAIEEKQQKNPSYSCRCAAQKIGISSGTLTRILNGTRHIGPALLPKLIAYLGLKQREAEYFSLLVKFTSARNEVERRSCYHAMLKVRSGKQALVPEEKHPFFEQWYNVALYELLRISGTTCESAILGTLLKPQVSESKIRKAIALLKRLGLLSQEKDGAACSVEPFLTTGDQWESVAIHAFQVAVAQLAAKALDTFPKSERDFSTLTMALSPEAFERIRTVLSNARAEIGTIERECSNPTRVYQINMQCFPLSSELDNNNREQPDA